LIYVALGTYALNCRDAQAKLLHFNAYTFHMPLPAQVFHSAASCT